MYGFGGSKRKRKERESLFPPFTHIKLRDKNLKSVAAAEGVIKFNLLCKQRSACNGRLDVLYLTALIFNSISLGQEKKKKKDQKTNASKRAFIGILFVYILNYIMYINDKNISCTLSLWVKGSFIR